MNPSEHWMGLAPGHAGAARISRPPLLGAALPIYGVATAAAAFLGGLGPAAATLGVMLAASPWLPARPASHGSTGRATAMGQGLHSISRGDGGASGGRRRWSADRRDQAGPAASAPAGGPPEHPPEPSEGDDEESRFRQVAEAVPQIVYITAADDSLEFLNRRWFDYTGAARDHAEVKDAWLAAIHPDDVELVLGARSRSREHGDGTEIEYRIRGRDGNYRWFLGRSVWIRDDDGKLVRRIGTATDIDDQKRAVRAARFQADAGARLAALTDAETALREVARLAVPAFADWCAADILDSRGGLRRVAAVHDERDPDWVVQTVSHRYRLRPDVSGGLFEVLAKRRPSLIADLTDEILRAAARNEEHLTALRAFAPRSYMCVPLVGHEGVLGALSFVTSRSGRRFDDDDLALAVDLGARAAVALENARLLDRLREADRRKDEFLATLAHELRNPMAPISNAVSILRFRGATDPDSRWAHDVIDRQVTHLARLVDDLLDVSRISRGKLELRPDRMDLAASAADAVEIVRPAVDARRQRLRVDLPPGPIPMVADRTRVTQLVANLLDNASKFSDHNATIDLRVARGDGSVEIRVADQGAGIPADQLPRVFEMFAQFTPILERAQGGLGIGLALARGIVQLHGGTIEALSPGPGQGSTFIVRLPLVPATSEGRPSPPSARQHEEDRRDRRRVLVVDDNEDIAESLGRLLSLHGCEVQLAHDGMTALRMAGSLRPEFAILDIGLPGMNGYEVAEAIRGEPWGRDVVLVAVTGWGRANDRRRSAEAGFDHHLVKPVEAAALARIIADSGPDGS
ncbi:ATP-binding protein [Paludisphaera sp.]|uniref:hybrid sensor histidine kinase/response regulator n=1 Tax=Paludisphaera sp. TaxID=2017432 RepID=UPI00301C4D43